MKKRIWLGVVLTAAAMLFFFFGPTQLGGPASYIVINGNSMEPGYHRGDLVIVRERAEYMEGDILAYRHPELGVVIHRIIGRDGGRFVLQGDNNDFVDGYHPELAEAVGSPVLHIPAVGKHLMKRRTPIVFLSVLLLSVSVFGLARDDSPVRRARRRKHRRTSSWSESDAAAGEERS